MSVRRCVSAVAALAGVVGLAGCGAAEAGADPAPTEVSEPPAEEPHWSYAGEEGPEHWGDLSDAYALCADGSRQSPVDLPAEPPATGSATTVEVGDAHGVVADTGHTFQFTADDDGAGTGLAYDGSEYELVQMHYHIPSEHTVEEEPADVELHFVHRNDDEELLVLGVLVDEGRATPAMQPFADAVHADAETHTDLDIASILPEDSAAYVYDGSLTTPPCSEDVHWIVLQERITVSTEQLETLSHGAHGNARPVQPRGDREITGSDVTFAAE